MQILQLSFIALLVAAAAVRIEAQPASPELQGKALELLRKTLSQDNQQPMQPAQPLQPAQAAPMSSPTTAATPNAPLQPASAQQQDQAIARLRATLAQERYDQRPPLAGSQPRPPMNSSRPPEPKSGSAPLHNAFSSRPAAAVVTPAAPGEPSAAKTKQQKLMDLLELYRADKLSPAEYHAQRAKILSEP